MRKAGRALKKYFIPHEENEYKPHILRPRAVLFVCLVAIAIESIFIFSSSYIIPRFKLFGLIITNALVDRTNQARVASGLPALRENPLLNLAAEEKARDMVVNNYFAHTSPSGVTPWYWFSKAGYDFDIAGENLAVDFTDSADVTNAWLNSPGHRANIMSAGYTDIGMAVAQGNFEGHPAIYVVELFGTPARPAPFTLAPVAKAAPTLLTSPKTTTTQYVAPATSAVPVASTPILEKITSSGLSLGLSFKSNPLSAAVADPRRTVDYIYFGIALVFAAALILNIFIKIRIQYPQLILGGMLVILVTGLIIVMNQHFGPASVVIV